MPSAHRPVGRCRSAESGRPPARDSSSSSRGTSCACPDSARNRRPLAWTSMTKDASRAFSRPRISRGNLRGFAAAISRARGSRNHDAAARPRQSALANPCAGRGVVEPPGATGPTGDWEKLYATSNVATLPWYNPDLDVDIERALKAHRLRGVHLLDLGTGPATQAMSLAIRGFDVVATDISGSAIKKA